MHFRSGGKTEEEGFMPSVGMIEQTTVCESE